MAIIQRASNEKLNDTKYTGNWRPTAYRIGGTLAAVGGLGALAYGINKIVPPLSPLVEYSPIQMIDMNDLAYKFY